VSPDRLILPSEDAASLARWRALHLEAPHDHPLPLDARVASGLRALAEVAGGMASWWGCTLLRLHLHGRLRVEQVDPIVRRRRHAAHGSRLDSQGLWIPAALFDELSTPAMRQGRPVAESAHEVLWTQLFGSLPEESQPDLHAADWQADTVSSKVWLPARVEDGLGLLADYLTVARSDVVRNLLLCHLIGRLRYAIAAADGSWTVCRRDTDVDRVLFDITENPAAEPPPPPPPRAPRTAFIAAQGKSVRAFRFFLPPPMKHALHRSAEHVGMRLSHHLRHLVLSALHGHLGAGDAGRRPGTR
jgi:hypothetical protein